MTDELIVASQKAFCVERAVEYVALLPESKLGFALSTKGKHPINERKAMTTPKNSFQYNQGRFDGARLPLPQTERLQASKSRKSETLVLIDRHF